MRRFLGLLFLTLSVAVLGGAQISAPSPCGEGCGTPAPVEQEGGGTPAPVEQEGGRTPAPVEQIVTPPLPVDNTAQSSPSQADTLLKRGPTFQYGFDWRFRPEGMDNFSDFNSAKNDTQQRFRLRTRVWGQLAVSDDVDVYLRLANEWRKQTSPDQSLSSSFPDETVVDNLYVNFKKLFADGLSLRVGRQDIVRADGFIFGDGTALDGSRTGYLNAFDLGYAMGKSKIEMIGAFQPKTDHYLPRINDLDKQLVEYNEGVIGAYFTTSYFRKTDVDLYYLLKRETNDYRSASSYAFTPDRHFTTVGGRVNSAVGQGWTATGEFAYQFGAQHANFVTGAPPADISGWGGFGTIKKSFERTPSKPYASAGYFVLSGDDYRTPNKVEGWDPVFSRFAIRSDLLFNAFKSEKGTGYWTNLRMPALTVGVQPSKRLNAYVSYMYVDAFHPFMIGPSSIFGGGTHRGSLIFTRAEVQLRESLTAQCQYETMSPGDYYVGHDRAYYFRAQVMYTFAGAIGIRRQKNK